MKPRENQKQQPQSLARSDEATQTIEQETSQTATASASPSGELAKYAQLCSDLSSRVEELEKLHTDRAGFQTEAERLKTERAELESGVLDGVVDAGKSLATLADTELVNSARQSALARRIKVRESELHSRLPLALVTFERLRNYVCSSVLESCRARVRALIDPSTLVDPAAIDAIAICGADFVAASRIHIPALSFSWNQPLDPPELHWNSLTRPRTPAEKAQQRAQTIESLVQASNAAILAFRALCAAAAPFAQGDIPPFKCEPEAPAPPQPSVPLEWLGPLGGSDEEWLRQVCEQGGKPYPPADPAQIEILNRMLEQRRAHPIAFGTISGEMLGSTRPL